MWRRIDREIARLERRNISEVDKLHSAENRIGHWESKMKLSPKGF